MYYLKVPLIYLSAESPSFEELKKSVVKDAKSGNIPSWVVSEDTDGIVGVEIVEE
jgi:hypothetical protein